MEAGQKKDRKVCKTATERQVVRTTSRSKQGSKEQVGRGQTWRQVGRAANRWASRQGSKQTNSNDT